MVELLLRIGFSSVRELRNDIYYSTGYLVVAER